VTDRWLRVTVRSPSDELSGLLAEGLVAWGGSAVEERDRELVTYFPGRSDGSGFAEALRQELGGILGTEPPDLTVEDVPEEDWLALWRSGLGPRRVGERIIVAPTWSEVTAEPGDLVIRLDPQMAFGTGEHATTRGVLRLMQGIGMPGARVLDVGTGSAILAIAAAKLGAASVVAVESDSEAMENAAENIERNAAGAAVTLLCDEVSDAFLAGRGGGAFDGIVANVLSGVLRPLLPSFHRSLAADGWAILSGILMEEAAVMRAAATAAGFDVESEDREEQWWSVLLRRGTS
jgi:ribosomal protein L11 methyltransferase